MNRAHVVKPIVCALVGLFQSHRKLDQPSDRCNSYDGHQPEQKGRWPESQLLLWHCVHRIRAVRAFGGWSGFPM